MKRQLEDAFIYIKKRRITSINTKCRQVSHHSPYPNIWNCTLEERPWEGYSASVSSGVSKLSGSTGSVSNVSSKAFSSNPREEGELEEKEAELCDYRDIINNKFDDFVDVDKKISSSKKNARLIEVLKKLLVTNDTILDVYQFGMSLLKDCHQNICILRAMQMVLSKANNESTYIKKIIECFKKTYGSVSSLYTLLLDLKVEKGVKFCVAFAPYSLDILITILPSLFGIYQEMKVWQKVTSNLKSLIHSTLLMCCSFAEYAAEEDRVNTVRSIFHLIKVLLPVGRITSHPCVKEQSNNCYKDHLGHLMQMVIKDYLMGNSFKPASLVLLHIQNNMGIRTTNTAELCNASSDIVHSLVFDQVNISIQSGCVKRQFPVGYLDDQHYNINNVLRACESTELSTESGTIADTVGSGIGCLWYKLNYWLLLLLEDNNANIKNIALKIIKHILITTEFIEKVRQHIISLVTDCLGDSATFDCAMAALVATSYIYPLKDGAVRRISSLTLKGRDMRDRIEVIKSLGGSCFSNKGLGSFINILQTLCEPMKSDEQKGSNTQYATSSIYNHKSEVLFSFYEWNEILETLRRIKSSIAQRSYVHWTDETGAINPVDICETSWMRVLWSYMLEEEFRRPTLSFIRRSEALIRFPLDVSLYPSLNAGEYFTEAEKTVSCFFHSDMYPPNHDHIRGKETFIHIHKNRIKGGILTIRKFKDRYRNRVNAEISVEKGKRCSCIDCTMDKIILSSKVKKSLNRLNGHTTCSADYVETQEERKDDVMHMMKNDHAASNIFGGEAVVGYYHKFVKGMTEDYVNIDDTCCVSFPSHLGSLVFCELPTTDKHSKWIGLVMKNLQLMKSRSKDGVNFETVNEIKKHESGFLQMHVTHSPPTILPTAIEMSPLVYTKSRKPLLGQKRTTWFHSKRIKG